MHYAQLELDRIKTNVRPQQLQVKPDPIQVLESAYHMTTLDAQNEVKYYFYWEREKYSLCYYYRVL